MSVEKTQVFLPLLMSPSVSTVCSFADFQAVFDFAASTMGPVQSYCH